MHRNVTAIFSLSWIVTQPLPQTIAGPISLKPDMTAQVFFKPLKADPIDQKTLASLGAVRRIQQSQTQSMDALLSLSFKLNAMTSVSAMMMPER
jgi:hypothetical protein